MVLSRRPLQVRCRPTGSGCNRKIRSRKSSLSTSIASEYTSQDWFATDSGKCHGRSLRKASFARETSCRAHRECQRSRSYPTAVCASSHFPSIRTSDFLEQRFCYKRLVSGIIVPHICLSEPGTCKIIKDCLKSQIANRK